MAFSATRMLMAAGGITVTPSSSASFFNDTSTSSALTHSGTGITNASTGIFSCWINLTAFSASTNYIFSQTSGHVDIHVNASKVVTIILTDASGSNSFTIVGTTVLSTGTWYNVLLSWNTNFAAGSKIFNMYINNVADSFSATDVSSAFTIGYSGGTYKMSLNSDAADALNGCMAEIYCAAGQFLDFSISGNRALFYSAGHPANLGANGATPTGTSPTFYWKGKNTDLTNLGSLGGSFTNAGDVITACGSAP